MLKFSTIIGTDSDKGASVTTAPGAEVEITGATKLFGAKVALDHVDLAVPAGSFCVLLGPSGSGKTTLLRSVAGIERLSSGQVRIGGRLVADGADHRPPERRNLAMVFQDYALWPHLSAAGNVEFALGRRQLGRTEASRRARAMLERVGLGHLADRYPNQLSGGEQQRVALARALVASTEVLLFDEPLSNLDADLRERMRLEIGTLARESGATSLYITHDQSEAFALADQVGVLRSGRLVQIGTPEDIYHAPTDPFVARFTGLAGELAVTVAGETRGESEEAMFTVRPRGLDDGQGRPIVAHAPAGAPGAADASLLLRPAGVRLLPPGHPDRHLEAIVVDTAYRGRGYDHAVLLSDGTQLVGIHDERRWNRGENVGIELAPSGCLLFDVALPDSGHSDSAA
ncbi:MAG: ABC transporter ATP-binding protein [Acidimicrobiaceae bacterium]|nr:ABC transporter ATP-binding protein [Acidimicrobiaceae bacterium]